MREVVTGRGGKGIRALAVPALVVLVLVLAAPASASSSPAPVAPAPAVQASPAATALSCSLSQSSVAFGDQVTVTGALTPAAGGEVVDVTLGGARVGQATVDTAGAYAFTFAPRSGGDIVVALDADPTVVGGPQALAVKPAVAVTHGALVPFLAAPVVVRIAPAAYDGLVVVTVAHGGAVAGTYKAHASNGKATVRVPFRGVDGFVVSVALPAAAGLDARTVSTRVSVRARTLSIGSSGPYVKGMLTALAGLRFRVPDLGTHFTAQVKDSVVAFQKAYGLSRSYVFSTACWRKADGARLIRPRHVSPGTHLEVDKGRQIGMVVRDGKPYGIICVSTGATGNTPEGTFHIRQKSSFTTSGYGGILVRTMGFIGNFAMHGYAPVPPYPASHGCVREPIWASYWMYDQSWVGETLYIYH